MIEITAGIRIGEDEIEEEFVRASGPGGQNVNKVSSAVALRFDARSSRSLPEAVRERLLRLAGKRATTDGVLVIKAQRFRTQEKNRAEARQQLASLIQQAVIEPKRRRATRPTLASQQRRLESKRQRSQTKNQRRSIPRSDD